MKTRIIYISLSIFLWLMAVVIPVAAQAGGVPVINEPASGIAIQGIVSINGSTETEGFTYSEISFSYAGDPTGTWFLIAVATAPVTNGTLATWDTTSITDGNYQLRLRVYKQDGGVQDTFVYNLRVRNYTPIETPTPAPPAPTALRPTAIPTATLTPTPFPTPTLMSANPAILTSMDVSRSLGIGGAGAVVLLAVMGIYLWLKRK